MRPPHSVLATILLGLAAVAVGVWKLPSVPLTTLALFLAAVILTELFEASAQERSREPVEDIRFRLASGVHIAAALMLGWAAVLVACAGVLAGAAFRGGPVRTVAFRAAAFSSATAAAVGAFQLAGGDVGRLRLLGDVVPLVALGLAYLTVRALLLDVVLGRESFEPRLATSAGEVAFGAVIGLLAIAHPWNAVVVLPLALAVHQANDRLTRLRRETLRALETFANIVDERDPSTYRHSIRVAGYVEGLARAFRLPFSDIDRLRWAGRLHDLGKVAVDATVLRKPDRLDRDEWASMRRHPRLSARLLQRFSFVATQARAVELHHERFDGGGYYGVRADQLPLAAHFLIVADSFDAMTTGRPYRRGLSHDEALAEIERNIGTQFHPTVARAFIALRRGIRPEDALSPEELDEVRSAAASYRLGVMPGGRDLKQRPEVLALGGTVLALVGLGFHETWVAAAGAAVATGGLALSALARVRSERLTASLRAVLHEKLERPAAFDVFLERLSRMWPIGWAVLVDWDEDGLGGRVTRERGAGPGTSALTSWLVREAESGSDLIVAPGIELDLSGIVVALPLRRETSALAGFLVLEGRRLPPRSVELALLETLDELGLALVERPALGGGAGEHPESLEAGPDARDLVVSRRDER